ncbi:MAG: hypothetical protein HQK50_01405 [Oligoflexia bacterium]|nr:hypothetical protein [Oligoflexia bacterium]MBF0364194.1 hypothetical protein [Oligoflexia bacterium]
MKGVRVITLLTLLFSIALLPSFLSSSAYSSVELEASWSSNAYAPTEKANTQELSLALNTALALNKYTHLLKLEASRTITDAYSAVSVSDGAYIVARPFWQYQELLSISGGSSITLPLSSKSRFNDSLLTKAALFTSLKLTLFHSLLKNIEISYTPAIGKYFYKYATTREGKSNPGHALENTLSLKESPTERLSFTLLFAAVSKWSEQGKTLAPSYAFKQEVTYNFPTREVTLTLGHSQVDKLYKGPTANELHIQLHDPYASNFYFSLAKVF